jgi:hypothetical protein
VTGAGGLNQSLPVLYGNNINAGTATASAAYAGSANYTDSSDSTSFTIGQAASTTVVSCGVALAYTGAPQTPCSANVTGAGGLNQSLPVLYGNNTNAGNATASAAYAGNANYTDSSNAVTFVIPRANATITVAGYDVVSDGAAHTSTGSATGVLNETLSGLNLAATTHTAIGVYQDTWTFTDGTGNYNAVNGTVTNIIRGGSTPPAAARLWVGLKNSDDQGTQFDFLVALYVNGTLIKQGQTLCVSGITRNPSMAQEVTVPLDATSNVAVTRGDVLTFKVSTRIGTTPNGSKCSGHNNATGLRLYYDAANRASGFGAAFTPGPPTDYFLKLVGTALVFDASIPVATQPKQKDSAQVNYAGGNAWREVGTWSRVVP